MRDILHISYCGLPISFIQYVILNRIISVNIWICKIVFSNNAVKRIQASPLSQKCPFLNFSCMFLNPNNFLQFESNCSNLLDLRNLQEEVKKYPLCSQKLFWPFTVWTYCSGDFKNLANSLLSAWNFKSFSSITRIDLFHSRSEQFW